MDRFPDILQSLIVFDILKGFRQFDRHDGFDIGRIVADDKKPYLLPAVFQEPFPRYRSLSRWYTKLPGSYRQATSTDGVTLSGTNLLILVVSILQVFRLFIFVRSQEFFLILHFQFLERLGFVGKGVGYSYTTRRMVLNR